MQGEGEVKGRGVGDLQEDDHEEFYTIINTFIPFPELETGG